MTGAFDCISVVIRHTLVQILTPDRMRGRVSAISGMFISASNELGEFESGTLARLTSPIVCRGQRRHRHAAGRDCRGAGDSRTAQLRSA